MRKLLPAQGPREQAGACCKVISMPSQQDPAAAAHLFSKEQLVKQAKHFLHLGPRSHGATGRPECAPRALLGLQSCCKRILQPAEEARRHVDVMSASSAHGGRHLES